MRLRSLVVVTFLASAACTPKASDVEVAVVPSPVLITGFNYGHGRIVDQARFTVRITELVGLGFGIVSLTADGVDVGTGRAVGEAGFPEPNFARHVDPLGSVAIEMAWGVARDFGDPFRPRRFEVVLLYEDDKGNRRERRITAPGTYQ